MIDRGIDLSALGFLSPRPKVVRASPSRGDAAAFCSLPVHGGGRYIGASNKTPRENRPGSVATLKAAVSQGSKSARALTLRTNNSRHRSGVRWKTWATPLLCTWTSIRAKEINNLSSSFWNARFFFSQHAQCADELLLHTAVIYIVLLSKLITPKPFGLSGAEILHCASWLIAKKTFREELYSHESWFENDCLYTFKGNRKSIVKDTILHAL